jgi:hypothetical protein
MKQENIVQKIVLLGSILIFIGNIYLFVRHIDFFLNKKKSKGDIVNFVESSNKDGVILFINYYNDYEKSWKNGNVHVRYSMEREFQGDNSKNVNVIYTKWFRQFFLSGYKTPRFGIFIFDIFVFVLMWFGIKYGVSKDNFQNR